MPHILTSRFLFGPGPSNCYPEAMAALAYPVLGHLDPVFIERLDHTCEGLRTVWGGTSNARTLPLSATGSGGMEAAFVNTVSDGDVAVIAVNGLFGARMCEVARRCGATVIRVDHEWGQPVDAERVLSAHPNPKVIAAVHAETSVGVLSDIAALGAGKGDALLITDAVTSIGGLELRADDWGGSTSDTPERRNALVCRQDFRPSRCPTVPLSVASKIRAPGTSISGCWAGMSVPPVVPGRITTQRRSP